jgi:hypothetical protein
MNARRQMLVLSLACVLGLPIALGAPSQASASCAYTWTGLITDSASGTYGRFSVSSTVYYKLEMNTCNLGVYTRIFVDTYVDRFTITQDEPFGWTYATDNSAVLKNCSGLTSGCLLYPGPAAYVDNRLFKRTGNGTITRTTYPGVTYAYSQYSAVGDRLKVIDGGVIFHFDYQFVRDVMYIG